MNACTTATGEAAVTLASPTPHTIDTAAPVLVVDDDPRIRQVIQWALEDEGLTVELAADGLQAIEKAAHQRPALVVLDWMLPGLDGHGVAAWLRATYGQTLPILVITAEGR